MKLLILYTGLRIFSSVIMENLIQAVTAFFFYHPYFNMHNILEFSKDFLKNHVKWTGWKLSPVF